MSIFSGLCKSLKNLFYPDWICFENLSDSSLSLLTRKNGWLLNISLLQYVTSLYGTNVKMNEVMLGKCLAQSLAQVTNQNISSFSSSWPVLFTKASKSLRLFIVPTPSDGFDLLFLPHSPLQADASYPPQHLDNLFLCEQPESSWKTNFSIHGTVNQNT